MFSKRICVVLAGALFLASTSIAHASTHNQLFGGLLGAGVQLIPQLVKSLGGSGGQPHKTCIDWVEQMRRTGKKTPPPPCSEDSPRGPVPGICQLDKLCRATSAPGGNLDASGQGLQQILQQLMQKLMQPDQQQPPTGGGEFLGGTGSTTLGGSQYPPCQINPAMNTVSIVPCVDSTGALVTNSQWLGAGATGGSDTSGGSGTAGSIADLLTGSLQSGSGSSGSSGGNSGDNLLEALTGQTQGSSASTTSAPNTQVSTNNASQLGPKNAAGDIVVNQGGVTAVAGTRDQQGNVEVAGFVGSNTSGLQESKSATARLCESRPWSTGFLSTIIAPSFFDGVCAWRGYNVGPANIPLVTPVYLRPTSAPSTQKPAQVQQVTPIVQPASVEIWASPASVPLGTRTSIFWKAEGGAVSCKTSGPSFTQSGLSGGAATVPISGSSTFTVVCLNAAGEEAARDSVTVTLSI